MHNDCKKANHGLACGLQQASPLGSRAEAKWADTQKGRKISHQIQKARTSKIDLCQPILLPPPAEGWLVGGLKRAH